MRLFWKDQLPLLLFYLLQVLLVPVLYWISGENRPPVIIGYGVLLSGSILLLYLGYRYVQHRRLYKLLSTPRNFSADDLTPLEMLRFPRPFMSYYRTWTASIRRR